MKAIITPLLIAASASRLFAAEPVKSDGFADGIDRSDPNFVTASLLVMSPGDELYSCAGHSVLRLECPTFNLDYCFSYESESVKHKIISFFRGKLKMGMFAIPTEEYLNLGRESGRGIMQYRLNLPADAKQRLWELLDKKVAEGPNLPYDYLKRGCAQSCFSVLKEALWPYELTIPEWPERFTKWTRREFVDAAVQEYPWTKFILYTIVGTESDRTVTKSQKVVIPGDVLVLLKTATINGTPVIVAEGDELLPAQPKDKPSSFTPFVVSCMVLLSAAFNFLVKSAWLDAVFLVFQSLLGAFLTYLVFGSELTATDWNWLIVPFNLMPLILWKWRCKWALWVVAILILWEIGMIAYPHRLTDPAYLVLVGAYIIFYLKVTKKGKVVLLCDRKKSNKERKQR